MPTTRSTAANLSSRSGIYSSSLNDLREDNPLKRPRSDMDKAGDHVETLDDLLARMQSMFNQTNIKIENTVESCKLELGREIGGLREEMQLFEAKYEKLSSTVDDVRGCVHANTERIRAAEKASDLLLSGVPYSLNENVNEFSLKIALLLGYTERNAPLVCAKRLAREPIVVGSNPPILLQFAFKIARDDFFHRYLGSRSLSLTHLGFNVNKRIYLNENLTKLARDIKGSALKLKKDGRLHSVFTREGVVHVKKTPDGESQPIYTEDQLAE